MNDWLTKIIVSTLLVLILVSLFSALAVLFRKESRSKRLVQALTVRVSLSIGLFALLLAGFYFGLIPQQGLRSVSYTHLDVYKRQRSDWLVTSSCALDIVKALKDQGQDVYKRQVKNVLAIATGLCDGLGLGLNARAALITRGLTEMTRLGVALGARAETFMGLSGLGDLVLTATGDLSRNRQVLSLIHI